MQRFDSIVVEDGNPVYHSDGNCLIETGSKTLIAGCKSSVIPNDGSVTSIGNYAFDGCSGLTSVTIPDSVTSIGNGAFRGCSGLTSITIPFVGERADGTGATYFGYIFGASSYSSNEDYVPSSLKEVIITGGESIDSDVFYGCSGLTSVTISDSVTSIGGSAFYGCSGLTSITIPDSVTSIGGSAFYGCSGLTSITIPFVGERADGTGATHFGYIFGASEYGENDDYVPETLKEVIITGGANIGERAFYYCSGLTSVTIPDGVTSIGEWAFYYCTDLTSVTIPDGVTSIGEWAFFYCTDLTSVTIPDSVTSIGGYAFSYCYGLTSVTIGNGVTSIGYRAFDECSGLTSVTIPDSVTSIGDYAFSGCSGLTSVTIPDSVTSIGDYVFSGCRGLTSVTIPDSVTSIGSGAFSGCSGLTSIVVEDGNPVYHSDGNCIIETASKTLIAGCKSSVIPDDESVTSIGNYAFYRCSGLTSVTIPDSVTSIGRSAFSGCSGLTSVTIPDSVTSIGDWAFYYCGDLTDITFQGTKAQWQAVEKGSDWAMNTGAFTVICTDGTISKADA